MGQEYYLVSQDAQRALEEFAEDFALALAQTPAQQWAKEAGLYKSSRALKTTYPLPVDGAGYREFLGDVKYRSLFHKSLTLIPKTWQDGVAELASIVEAPDFSGWAKAPEAMAAAALSLPNEIIAAAIEANAVQDFDGKAFFAGDHPCNVFNSSVGTFDNDHAGAVSIANLATAKERFRKIKGPNGKPLGLRLTHILCPPAQEEEWLDIRDRQLYVESATIGSVDNRHRGTFGLLVGDELTSDSYWYALALNKPGAFPWIVQDEGAPEEIRSDKTSALYKTKLMVGVAYILRGNGALALPQVVQRYSGSD